MELHAEVAVDARAEVGEGPSWDPLREELLWVDVPRGAVHRHDPVARADRVEEVGQPVGAVAVREQGGLVLAVRDGFATFERGEARIIAEVERGLADNRMNDGKVDPGGRFWAGTMALDMRYGAGALYRLDPDLHVHTMLTGVSVSNGMDWSSDGRTMYFIDSGAQRVDAFDYDAQTGAVSARRPLIGIPPSYGMPDGMTLDAEGFLWVALWDGWAVRRFAPDGTPAGIVNLPASQVTSCAFGGRDLADLYITTASSGLSEAERAAQPQAGAVFRCRPGVRGRAPNRFSA